jgi:hypothetical protein
MMIPKFIAAFFFGARSGGVAPERMHERLGTAEQKKPRAAM